MSCRGSGNNTRTTPTTKFPTSQYSRQTTTPRQAQKATSYPYVRYAWRTTPRTNTDYETVVILSATGPVLLCVCIAMSVCFVKRVKRRKIKDQHAGNPQWNSTPGRAMHEPDFAVFYEPDVSHAEFDVKRLTGAQPVRPPSYRETPDISTLSYPNPPPPYRSAPSASRSRAAMSDSPPSYRSTPATSRPQVRMSDPPPSYRSTPSISSSRAARSDRPQSYRTTAATPGARAARSDRPPSYRTTAATSGSRAGRSDRPPSYRTTAATPSQR